jgi:hypothetical protein
MSWQSDDGRHEGWAEAEFPGGWFSHGSTSGGAMVNRRDPVTGRRDAYDTLNPEVRDGREAIGWRGICECGWRGELWQRVDRPEDDDRAARRVHEPDPSRYGDAPTEVEDTIHAEWKAHLGPGRGRLRAPPGRRRRPRRTGRAHQGRPRCPPGRPVVDRRRPQRRHQPPVRPRTVGEAHGPRGGDTNPALTSQRTSAATARKKTEDPMPSFRTVYVPQCRDCSTAVTDPDGRETVVTQTLLPQQLHDRLTAAGWEVDAGDAHHGRHDHLLGDKLTYPGCLTRQRAAERAHHDLFHQPPVKELDMAARLGPGWTLRQRAGDAETHSWLVTYQGQVKDMVRRYRRKSDGEWSKGWEALLGGGAGFVRHSATAAGSLHQGSSFLWRSRDLAAWGTAAGPAHGAPNPDWATRRRT